MPTTNHPTHSTPTLRSNIDVPQMCSDLFYEENPCGLILARGISKKATTLSYHFGCFLKGSLTVVQASLSHITVRLL